MLYYFNIIFIFIYLFFWIFCNNIITRNVTRALICSCSILVSVLTCYWKFKTEGRSAVEVAGSTGGLLQMASILNSSCGRCILYGIRTFISTNIGMNTYLKKLN